MGSPYHCVPSRNGAMGGPSSLTLWVPSVVESTKFRLCSVWVESCLELVWCVSVGDCRVVVHTSVPLRLRKLILEVHVRDYGCRHLPAPTTK